ncbi:Crp/Fnr family transcriptional regulator [Pedobacter jamesrossensis]|uniref:Crp/Fnr family transcriptional regulator n=1 Tax=Pedobacter jamesrossensis TaxID=1908238 RepID=A0ABV8NPW9_9SPHI
MYHQLKTYITSRSSISEEILDLICNHFILVKARRNEILIGFNEVCKGYYFVNEGCLRLFTYNIDGNETTRYFGFKGGFCTALPSFIQQTVALEYLQAISKSELLYISRSDFFHLVDMVPQFAMIYREILELGFINAQKRIYGFQGFNALEKVRWIIEFQPDFLLRLSNKMAASYLGISPSTLSRIKSRL